MFFNRVFGKCQIKGVSLMSKHFSLYFLVFLGIGRIAYGSYGVHAVDIPELHGRTIQADYITQVD